MVADGTDLTTDVAIVGSGPAGLSLAMELDRAGLRSLVLESGNEPYASRWDLSSNALRAADYGMGKPYLDLHVQRALGGGVNVWGGWCAALRDVNFTPNEADGYSGWPLSRDDLMPHYRRAHEMLEIDAAAPLILDPPTQLASAPDVAIYGYALSPVRGMPAHLLQRLQKSEKIDLRTGATVTRIEARGGKVLALHGTAPDGRQFVVRARRYVAAGGSVLNAMLLQRELPSLVPDPARAAQVGKHLADHLYIYGRGRAFLKPEVENEIEKSARWFGGFLSLAPSADALKAIKSRDFHILLTRVDEKLWDGAERAAAANHQQIFGQSPRLYSLIIGMEAAVVAKGSVSASQASAQAGVVDLQVSDTQTAHGEMAVDWLKKNAAAAWFDKAKADDIVAVGHLMGTTRMETASAPGPVDRDCRVIGTPNLYILGSSVFPTTGFANPTFTIVALAARLAQHLGETRDAP